MKPHGRRHLQWALLFCTASLAAAFHARSQGAAATLEAPGELLAHHRFVFIAEWATSTLQPRRYLSPTYELRVASDSVAGRLPFYGRVFSPSDASGMTVNGFSFGSRITSYDLRSKRNGTWLLVVEAAAGSNVQKLTFTISGDGSARLSINSPWRDAMYYDGRIASLQTR